MVLQSYKTLLVSQKDYINKGKVMKFDPSIPFIWFLSDFPDTKKLELCSRIAVKEDLHRKNDFSVIFPIQSS